MNAQSRPSRPKTSAVSLNVTSSPASASGAMPAASQGGLTTDLFGPVPVPAAPSAKPVSAKASKIRATYGRNGFGSSASAGLSCSLASNLMRRTRGSILFRLTWKTVATPSGRLLYLLRASGARTNATELGSWPTPTTPSGGQSVPLGTTAGGRRPDGSKATVTLENVAMLAGWPTPRASDGDKNIRTIEGVLAEVARKGCAQDLPQAAMLSGWGTPTATDRVRDEETLEKCANFRKRNANQNSVPLYLGEEARSACRDYRTPNLASFADRDGGRKGEQLNNQVIHQGPALIGSSAEIAAVARLNPAHARWLMRLPPVWDACAVTATPSTRKRSRTS
jgi:hypothetical protein